MPDGVLYFPYIRVPSNGWFTRVLLYWDEVGSIIPYEYSHRPERLGRYTAELIQAELVRPIIPGEYIGAIPRFADAFVEFLDTNRTVAERRQLPFERQTTFRIHMEKLGRIADELCGRGLARPSDPPWFEVEEFTAVQFMAYLAAVLGQVERLGYTPTTDQVEYLAAFSSEHNGKTALSVLKEQLRATILEGILPAPATGVQVKDLARFKSRYADSLRRFRRQVESYIIDLALIPDADARAQKVDLVKDQLREQIDELRAHMQRARWPRIVFGTLCSLSAAAVPAAAAVGAANLVEAGGALAGLIAAVYASFSGSGVQSQMMRSPLAYAALAQKRLA